MKQHFEDLLGTDGVLGLMLLSFEGEVVFTADPTNLLQAASVVDVALELSRSLTDATQEADMVFRNLRVYLRKTPAGPLLVILAPTAPIAMVRLHCDTLIPNLNPQEPTSGLKRLLGLWR
ncbi:MAG: hypothetical protein QNJ22_00470 [Desulfosarcinaceae bacterium]|nr:hypothetical protein [Desulfosarcinaceae bacterium]